jgi:hypothetical protein
LQEKEYFAARVAEIAEAPNKAARDRMIKALKTGNEYERKLFTGFISASRNAEAASVYAHVGKDDGGRFPLTGTGDVNDYALFSELILQINHKEGRAGFIVPTNIATDDTTKMYFSRISTTRLVSLYDFENRERIFPDVHENKQFCLISLGKSELADFCFFMTNIKHLEDERRHFTLSRSDFSLLNPNTETAPIFRSKEDAELNKKYIIKLQYW